MSGSKYCLDDFDILRVLGDGSFSEVIEVALKSTKEVFALKIVDKSLIVRKKQVTAIKQERELLAKLQHPGIVRLHFTFQDPDSLFFGLECCPNGDLYDQINLQSGLPAHACRFYAAEIVEVLACLQSHKVVHRDLKPENLLLDERGHLKLTDFGSAKLLGSEAAAGETTDLVGTADYSPPEALKGEPVGFGADLWALGCLVYQMHVGKPPFRAASEYLTFQRISDLKYDLPDTLGRDAACLIESLLVENPAERLGAKDGGLEDLRVHSYFKGIDWTDLWSQDAPRPITKTLDSNDTQDVSWALQSLSLQSSSV